MLIPAVLGTLLALSSHADAFWRLPCGDPLVVERADPIVSPGRVAGHVHTINGGSNFGLSNTFDQLRKSECTSCAVQQDMSNYWTPALYFQWANGSFSSVSQVGGGLIYYLQRTDSPSENITAFPDGHRMLIGTPSLRSYNGADQTAQAIGWNCLGASVQTTRQAYLPPYNCPDGLRGELRFPSCWDGVNNDSPDHFSHMSYSSRGEFGTCPSTHPVRVMTLFYEVMWSVDPWNAYRSQAMNATQPFVLAMGDPTGYGYHGDFNNGWDRNVLQTAINTCTSASGVIEECTIFDLAAYKNGGTCHKTPDVNEIVMGTLSALPGCNPVSYGPGNAASCTAPTTPAIFSSPTAYTGGAPPPNADVLSNAPRIVQSYNSSTGSWTYDDCYSDAASVRALPNGLSTSPQTVGTCLDACAAKGYQLCGIEYHGECWGGNTLASSSSPIGYGKCSLPCRDNSTQYCGGNNAFDLYRLTKLAASTAMSSSASLSAARTSSLSSLSNVNTVSASSGAAPTKPTSTVVSASSSPSPSSTLIGKVTTNPRWKYSGCNLDLVNGARSLPNSLSSNSTVDGCLAACDVKAFAVCGLSYFGECYGGAALSTGAGSTTANKCMSACANNKAQTCGGSGTLDVYLSTQVAAIKTPTTPNLASYGAWAYGNCYSDLVNNIRSLPTGLSSNSTIEGCLASCSAAKATACGLSYYGECWSSTTGLSNSSTVLPATSCQYPCKNNPLEWCGGSSALGVYFPKTPVAESKTPVKTPAKAPAKKAKKPKRRAILGPL